MTTSLPLIGASPLIGAGTSPGAGSSAGASELDTTAATTYTDLTALAALKKDPNSPQSINAVAQQVEALFLQMMLKSMRDATNGDESESNEMGMYQDMFDKQVALSISQHADLGIAKLLKRQVSGKAPPHGIGMPTTGTAPPGTSTAGGSAALAASSARTPGQFVGEVLPAVRRAADALGVSPGGMLAQAALETGWGQRVPHAADGSSSFNMFGIKAGEEWSGARVTADTMEVVNGVAHLKRAAFRAYGSIEESVKDFANLLKTSPRYRDTLAAGRDVLGYIEGIGRSGYATDPNYANKLKDIVSSEPIQASLRRTAAL